jgi:hypothetical protein
MWAREPSTTVGGNLMEVKKLLEKGSVLGYAPGSLVVPAGPFLLRDNQLILFASTMVLRLLDAGKNKPCVQYDTVRPMRSAVSNQWRASLDGQTASVMMQGTTKLITSTCPMRGVTRGPVFWDSLGNQARASPNELAILGMGVVAKVDGRSHFSKCGRV